MQLRGLKKRLALSYIFIIGIGTLPLLNHAVFAMHASLAVRYVYEYRVLNTRVVNTMGPFTNVDAKSCCNVLSDSIFHNTPIFTLTDLSCLHRHLHFKLRMWFVSLHHEIFRRKIVNI